MSQDHREKPAVKTTIVGGRPPGSGKEVDAIPRGIEILLKKAAIDESFRKTFLGDRLNAADAIGLTLQPVEAAMLKAIPDSALESMIAAAKVQPRIRQAFMGYTAAVMLAALTAASAGSTQDSSPAKDGIRSDPVQAGRVQTTGITAEMIGSPSWEEKQAAKLKAESYMRIAPPDENAPKGNLEVHVVDSGGIRTFFLKIRLTKATSTSSQADITEGLGYSRKGYFLQENIPVGEYIVEAGFGTSSSRGKKIIITVKEKETAAVTFTVKPTNRDEQSRGVFSEIE